MLAPRFFPHIKPDDVVCATFRVPMRPVINGQHVRRSASRNVRSCLSQSSTTVRTAYIYIWCASIDAGDTHLTRDQCLQPRHTSRHSAPEQRWPWAQPRTDFWPFSPTPSHFQQYRSTSKPPPKSCDTIPFEQAYDALVLLRAELEMLAGADVFSGTFTSNLGRVVAIMRHTRSKPPESTLSGDIPTWYFPGR